MSKYSRLKYTYTPMYLIYRLIHKKKNSLKTNKITGTTVTVQQVRNQLYSCTHMQQAFSDRAYQYYELFAISNQVS